MIYLIFVKKEKNQKGPSPISVVMNNFFKRFCDDEMILCLPGYMSYTQTSIDNFFNNLKFPNNSHVQFFTGMNGTRDLTSTKKVLDEHNIKGKSLGYFAEKDRDHSKMMFILDSTNIKLIDYHDLKLCSEISYDEFISVKAVLIGSSNQSDSTYFGSSAQYGEADLLLIDSNKFKDVNDESLKQFYEKLNIKNIIISKDIIHDSLDEESCEKLLDSIFDSVAEFKILSNQNVNK